jgi:2-C-methyl-D-erythritol 4-phosphate cytidylyltransferase
MNAALIVAAGRGTRMGGHVDKVLLEFEGVPVVGHTWRRFEECEAISEIILVVRDGMQDSFGALGAKMGFRKPHRFVAGGAERQDSVWNGLGALSPGVDLVAIQDAARPCTSLDLITRCLQIAQASGAAVAAQRATDTIKESDGGMVIAKHLDRSRLWSVQTPQCFQLPVIRRALETVRASGRVLTDDTAACELIGQPVQLVESTDPNPKITTPADLPLLRALLAQQRD